MSNFNHEFWEKAFPDEYKISRSPAISNATPEQLAVAIHDVRNLLDQFSNVSGPTHTLLSNEHASHVLWSCRMALEIKLKEHGARDNQIEGIQETGRLPK